jgi:hypothetical protein
MTKLIPSVANVTRALKAKGIPDSDIQAGLEFNFQKLRSQGKLSKYAKGPEGKKFMEEWMPYMGLKGTVQPNAQEAPDLTWQDLGNLARVAGEHPVETAKALGKGVLSGVGDMVTHPLRTLRENAVNMGSSAIGASLGAPLGPLGIAAGGMIGGLLGDTAMRSAESGQLKAPSPMDILMSPLNLAGGKGIAKRIGTEALEQALAKGAKHQVSKGVQKAVGVGRKDIRDLLSRKPGATAAPGPTIEHRAEAKAARMQQSGLEPLTEAHRPEYFSRLEPEPFPAPEAPIPAPRYPSSHGFTDEQRAAFARMLNPRIPAPEESIFSRMKKPIPKKRKGR